MSFITKDPLLGATLNNLELEIDRTNRARTNQILSDNSNQLKGNNVRLQQEVEQLKQDLYAANRKITKQDKIIADWMVSQKAFKELAIEFGFDDGLSAQEVIKMGLDKEIDVLECKHDPSHRTNATDGDYIKPHIEELKVKFKAERNK